MSEGAVDLIADVMSRVVHHATEMGVAESAAHDLARRVAVSIAQTWGGTAPYIPRTLALSARDRAIVDQFRGGNYRELAQQHGLSERWVRLIVERARLAAIAERHTDLFS